MKQGRWRKHYRITNQTIQTNNVRFEKERDL